jgi:hypothetical protein
MLLRLLIIIFPLIASAEIPSSFEEPQELIVNNRILTKVNGKTVSLMDVVKKMDVYLNRYYPQYVNSKPARFQFYIANWRETLNQMIDNELMMADAESREVRVSDGEVRQEIQERFGPNIQLSLSRINLTYEEARKMVHQDMIVQRMNWLRVTSKALQKVNSQDVKDAYKEFCNENPSQDEWKYQLLSIRADQHEIGAQLAKKASELLHIEGTDLSQAAEKLKAELPSETRVAINVSQDYEVADKVLSQAHKEVLASLVPGSFSAPVEQISRDNSIVYRLFHLKEHIKKDLPKFEDMANEIKDALLQKAASEEMIVYVNKLRQRFGYDPQSLDIPSDFEPFALK